MISFFPSGNIVTTHKPLVYSVHSDPGRYALLALAGKMLQTKSERERERERERRRVMTHYRLATIEQAL